MRFLFVGLLVLCACGNAGSSVDGSGVFVDAQWELFCAEGASDCVAPAAVDAFGFDGEPELSASCAIRDTGASLLISLAIHSGDQSLEIGGLQTGYAGGVALGSFCQASVNASPDVACGNLLASVEQPCQVTALTIDGADLGLELQCLGAGSWDLGSRGNPARVRMQSCQRD